MINYADIQNAYNDLYVEVRKYIWSFPAVEALADLEIACYQTCPDINNIKQALNRFRQYALEVMYDDEDMTETFDDFAELLDSDDTTYAKLNKVQEVLENENNIKQAR